MLSNDPNRNHRLASFCLNVYMQRSFISCIALLPNVLLMHSTRILSLCLQLVIAFSFVAGSLSMNCSSPVKVP